MDFKSVFINELIKLKKDSGSLRDTPSILLRDKIEEVSNNPYKYLDKDYVSLFNLLVSRNVYPSMIGRGFIVLLFDDLSLNNKRLLSELNNLLYKVTINSDGSIRIDASLEDLISLSNMFMIQDIPYGVAYMDPFDILIKYCGCYKYVKNSSFIEEPSRDLAIKYGNNGYNFLYRSYLELENNDKSIKEFDPDKMDKTIVEYAHEHGFIFDGDRVYVSCFHYYNYLRYCNTLDKQDGFSLNKKLDI